MRSNDNKISTHVINEIPHGNSRRPVKVPLHYVNPKNVNQMQRMMVRPPSKNGR
jgi:hypothetical protein